MVHQRTLAGSLICVLFREFEHKFRVFARYDLHILLSSQHFRVFTNAAAVQANIVHNPQTYATLTSKLGIIYTSLFIII